MTKKDMRALVNDMLARCIELQADLTALRDELRNRSPRTHGRPVSARVTPEMRARIAEYQQRHPSEPQHIIGRQFNVNQGRVSESVAGIRR